MDYDFGQAISLVSIPSFSISTRELYLLFVYCTCDSSVQDNPFRQWVSLLSLDNLAQETCWPTHTPFCTYLHTHKPVAAVYFFS